MHENQICIKLSGKFCRPGVNHDFGGMRPVIPRERHREKARPSGRRNTRRLIDPLPHENYPYRRALLLSKILFGTCQCPAVGRGVEVPSKKVRPLTGSVPDLPQVEARPRRGMNVEQDRKSTRLNSSHVKISYAVFCLKKNKFPSD